MARCSGSWSRRSRRRIADPSNQRFPLDLNPAVERRSNPVGIEPQFPCPRRLRRCPWRGSFVAYTREPFVRCLHAVHVLLQAREVTAMVGTTASNSIPAARLFSLAHRVLQRMFCDVANMCSTLHIDLTQRDKLTRVKSLWRSCARSKEPKMGFAAI